MNKHVTEYEQMELALWEAHYKAEDIDSLIEQWEGAQFTDVPQWIEEEGW